MIRKLLATTAVAALIAGGAIAQETTAPAAAPAAPAATDTAAPAAPEVIRADGFLASNLIGETVYNGTGDNAENIGNVNDVVINKDGKVASVVIGVGGFLGIGEKNVSLEFDKIGWAEKDGDRWIVVDASADQLKALPDFDRSAYDVAPVAAADQPVTDTTAMAPAAEQPATDTTAMAPAAEAPAVDKTKTAAIDKSTLTEIPAAEVRAEELVGTTVYGANDENVGEIGDIVLTTDGKPDSVIIDVGGFLGIGEKEVAVGFDKLAFMTDKDGHKYLYTAFTKEQLDAQPAYDASTWADKRDEQRLIVQ